MRLPGSSRALILFAASLLVFSWHGLGAQSQPPAAIESYRAGENLVLSGRYLEAIQRFQAALSVNPRYAPALSGLAEAYFYLDEFDEAYLNIEQAIVLDPRNIGYLNFKGRILLALGNPEAAGAVFDAIIEAAPFNRDALLGKAELLLSTGRINQAQQVYLNTLSIHPRDRKALLSLALVYQAQGSARESELYIQQALDYYSESPLVQTIAGRYYFDRSDFVRAEHHISLAIGMEPMNLEALFLQTSLYIRLGMFSNALRPLETAISIDPGSDLLWYTRALIQDALNRHEESTTSLRRALSYNPENEIARLFLETVVIDRTDFDDPIRTQLAEYRLAQARQYELQNRFDRAMAYLNRGITVNPLHEGLRRARAELFLKTQRYARYAEELEFLISEMGVVDRSLSDQLEVYRHTLLDSVSAQWGIDQFSVDRDFAIVSVYLKAGVSEHPNAVRFVGQQTAETLLGNERFSLNADPLLNGRYREPIPIGSQDEAFQDSRAVGSDYYLILDIAESNRSIELKADLFLSRTGRLVRSFSVTRTGNNRVAESVLRLVEEIDNSIPYRGTIVQRSLNTAVVNLGEEHGIEPNDRLVILPARTALLNPDGSSYQMPQDLILGHLEIVQSDAIVSEGVIESSSYFDSISLGDTILVPGASEEVNSGSSASSNFPLLYARIRGLR